MGGQSEVSVLFFPFYQQKRVSGSLNDVHFFEITVTFVFSQYGFGKKRGDCNFFGLVWIYGGEFGKNGLMSGNLSSGRCDGG